MRLFYIATLGALGCASAAATRAQASTEPVVAVEQRSHGCLTTGNGYLRAQIRGAMQLDVDLHNSELECAGGTRPDGSGIRVSFAGPVRSDGRRLRMVFGVGTAAEGTSGHALPTNLTVIFEGEQRLFATRGDDKCTVDDLTQERLGALGGSSRSYRVIARGFCISPVNALDAKEKILVSSFDFAGSVTFEDPEPDDAPGVTPAVTPGAATSALVPLAPRARLAPGTPGAATPSPSKRAAASLPAPVPMPK